MLPLLIQSKVILSGWWVGQFPQKEGWRSTMEANGEQCVLPTFHWLMAMWPVVNWGMQMY